MDDLTREVLSKYVQEMNGVRYFTGNENINEDVNATSIIAAACPLYQDDDEEEIYSEVLHTCYNCRYRRWVRSGFSCFKGFPVNLTPRRDKFKKHEERMMERKEGRT